ncbi:GWxTD domain-containing protein [Pontibacter sp. SGAir0037]|nr:GWxTD domain-containing protein [Pontibacter sp. SGAir0037]
MDLSEEVFRFDYAVRKGEGREAVTSAIKLLKRTTEQEAVYLTFALPQESFSAGDAFQLRAWQTSEGQERVVLSENITLRKEMLQKDYLLTKAGTGKPLFQTYLNASEQVVVVQEDTSKTIELQHLNADFPPALPPMAVSQEQQVPRTLKITKKLHFSSGDTIRFEEPGLYLVNASPGSATGILVRPEKFPLLTTADELIQPLIYMTTSTERRALYNAADPKAAVDEFWLRTAKDKSIARELIRVFYSRVEAANKAFTSHKSGWATDRGMIYIIFGQPDVVNQSGDVLTWTYRETNTSPYLKFVFNKKQNNFTENHYELVRRRDYEESWYSTVAKWRAGVTDI